MSMRWAHATWRLWSLLKESYERYDSRHGSLLAAAIAFYSLLSIAPIAVIAVTITGMVMDPETARAGLEKWITDASSRDIADLLVGALEAAQTQGTGIGTAVALLILLWGASRLFVVLQDALNAVWGVRTKPAQSAVSLARTVLAKRMLSFGMVIGCGALLLATLIAQTVITSIRGPLVDALGLEQFQGWLALISQGALALVVLTVLFVTLFRLLPDAYVGWKPAIVGSLLTAAMMIVGTLILGGYLSRIAPRWLQGALGSVAAFMLWSYYLGQVFLLGAALTRVSSVSNGESLRPEPHAELAE